MNGAQSKGIEPRSKQVRNLKYTVHTVVGEFVAPSWTSDFVTNNSYGESWPGTGLSPKLKMCPNR